MQPRVFHVPLRALVHVDVTATPASASDGETDVLAVAAETIGTFVAAVTVGAILYGRSGRFGMTALNRQLWKPSFENSSNNTTRCGHASP
jgi:hypothetical protein